MNDEQLSTLADLQGFLDGTVTMDFTVAGDERYAFIARTVKRFGYGRLKRADKAIVLRFLERVSGYSRQQMARRVKRGGEPYPLVKRYRGSRTSFARLYTAADIVLLTQTDTLMAPCQGWPSGSSWNTPTGSLATSAINVWQAFQWPTRTSRGKNRNTGSLGQSGPRPGPDDTHRRTPCAGAEQPPWLLACR